MFESEQDIHLDTNNDGQAEDVTEELFKALTVPSDDKAKKRHKKAKYKRSDENTNNICQVLLHPQQVEHQDPFDDMLGEESVLGASVSTRSSKAFDYTSGNDYCGSADLNKVLDEIVELNMPKVFRETTMLARNELTGDFVRQKCISNFFKRASINDINQIREDNSNWSDEDADDNGDFEAPNPKSAKIGLPDQHKLAKLSTIERKFASKVYLTLLGSALAYDECLKYAIAPQIAEIESERLKSAGGMYPDLLNTSDKVEVFKPPKAFEYGGKEYYFNAFTGKNSAYMNYRCRDYKRCRASMKLSTVDPLRQINLLKEHSHQCRSDRDWSFESQLAAYEHQLQFNKLIDLEVEKARQSVEHPASIFRRIEAQAKHHSATKEVYIFPPDRCSFMTKIKKVRSCINPRSTTDKILFTSKLRARQDGGKFLRSSLNLVDEDCKRQKAVIWFSEQQCRKLKKVAQVFVGLSYEHVPMGFYCLMVLAGISDKEEAFPGVYVLMTSDDCEDLYMQVFSYLRDIHSLKPNVINLSIQKCLETSLKKVYPKSMFIGCFQEFIKALLIYCYEHPSLKAMPLEELNYKMFRHIRKEFFRKSSFEHSYTKILESTSMQETDVQFRDLFAKIHSFLAENEQIMSYTIIKNVTLNPVEMFLDVFKREFESSSSITLIEFIQKLQIIDQKFVKTPQAVIPDSKDQITKDEKQETVNIIQTYDNCIDGYKRGRLGLKAKKKYYDYDSDEEIDLLNIIRGAQEDNNMRYNPPDRYIRLAQQSLGIQPLSKQ